MAEYSQEWHNGTSRGRSAKTSDGLVAIQAQLNNLGREIKKVNVSSRINQGASIKTLEIQIGQMSKVLRERGFGSLPSSTETNPRDHVKSISTTVEADAMITPISRASVSVMPLSTYLNLGLDFIILDMPEDIKVPLVLRRPFLSTAHAKIDVFKRKITLRVGEEKIIFKSIKPDSSIIKRVYMLSLRERMEIDSEARLMEETLLRRDQIDDFMPTIEEGEVIEEFRARNDARMINEIYGYPSDYDHDKKIRISYAYNLKFSCMIVLEDMNDYRDEGMGDVIFGEPFLREVGVKARRFNGMITIYNGDDKVSEDDERNEISYPYQKLKRFYKGALNLGPEFIRDLSMEEWLTRRHTSVHEMEE
ncbi:hypothetical protein Tco_0733562 [Tanacetum coccineum]